MTPADVLSRAQSLVRRSPLGPEEVEELVQVAGAVRELSQHRAAEVHHCTQLWDGLRHAEARQVAQLAHDLLPAHQLATLLGRLGWSGLCQLHGAPEPRSLDAHRIARLRTALSGAPSELELLLREYRRRTLGRASLRDRLAVLRQIEARDTRPLAWAQDLKELGRARLEELEGDLARAIAAEDEAALEALRLELNEGRWPEGQANALSERARQALEPLRRRAAEQRQAEVADRLREAHSAFDEGQARSLLGEWDAATREWPALPELAAEVQATEAWLEGLDREREEEQAYFAACAALEESLDDGAPREEIERLVGAIQRLERPMPKALQARTASRWDALRVAEQRAFVLRVVIAVGVLVLIGLASSASWAHHARQEAIRGLVDSLEVAVREEDAEGAARLLGELEGESGSLLEAPTVIALRGHAEALVEREAARRHELRTTVATLESASPLGEAYEQGLAKLASLARAPDEAAQVDEFERRRSEAISRTGEKSTRLARPELTLIRGAFQELREASLKTPGEAGIAQRADALIARIDALREEPYLAEELLTELASTRAALDRFMLRAQDLRREVEAVEHDLEAVREARGPELLAQALRDFARNHSSHPLAAGFLQRAELERAWLGLSKWRRLSGPWGSELHVSTQRTANERSSAIRAYLREFPASPQREEATAYLAYLQRAVEVLGVGAEFETEAMRQLRSSALLTSSYELRSRSGGVYYFLDPTRDVKLRSKSGPDRTIHELTYVVTAALDRQTGQWKSVEEGGPPRLKVSRPTLFMRRLEERLAVPFHVDWEVRYLELAQEARAAKLDPVLEATLVRLFLTLAQQTSAFPELEPPGLRSLAALGLDVAWMNPGAERAKRARNAARTALARLPKLAGSIATVRERLRAGASYEPIGVYLEGRLQSSALQARGDLYAFREGGRLQRVGSLDPQGARLEAGAAALLPGTLVFLREKEAQ